MSAGENLVVLTVGNSLQGELCAKIIGSSSVFAGADLKIISDENTDYRLGSGGAVLKITAEYSGKYKRILIINSGGLSKRSLNYSVRGKAFVNFFDKGNVRTLFSALTDRLLPLFGRFDRGMIISCNDILVDASDSDADFSFNCGFCVNENLETASRHGVMPSDENGFLTEFIHKVPAAKLRTVFRDEAPVDTGLVYLNGETCDAIKALMEDSTFASALAEYKKEINLYPDIISLLARNTSAYDRSDSVRDGLFRALSPFSMKCVKAGEKFIHFGTSPEILRNVNPGSTGYTAFNSCISEESSVGDGTIIDNAIIGGSSLVGKNCIITDVVLENVSVRSGTSVCGIRLSDGSYVTISTDIDADIEKIFDEPLFFRGYSYRDSYEKYLSGSTENFRRVSISYCLNHPDYNEHLDMRKFIPMYGRYRFSDEYRKYRSSIIDEWFRSNKGYRRLSFSMDKYELELPVRLNFSGTWTDAMPYCTDNGGRVINAAVTVDGVMPVYVSVEKTEDDCITFQSNSKKIRFNFGDEENFSDYFDFNLHKAALMVFGINRNTGFSHGFKLTTEVRNIDRSSGLGTSSILLAGCFTALGRIFGKELTEEKICRMVFVAEQLMGTGGGWQDQCGGMVPGIKVSSSLPGIPQNVSIERIPVSPEFGKFINEKLCLVYTDLRHFGRFVVSDVMQNYLEGRTVGTFENLSALNDRLRAAIENNDTEDFKVCINLQWEYEKRLSGLVSDSVTDGIADKCRPYADALCICGAGAGGFLLLVLKDKYTSSTLPEEFTSAFDVRKVKLCD